MSRYKVKSTLLGQLFKRFQTLLGQLFIRLIFAYFGHTSAKGVFGGWKAVFGAKSGVWGRKAVFGGGVKACLGYIYFLLTKVPGRDKAGPACPGESSLTKTTWRPLLYSVISPPKFKFTIQHSSLLFNIQVYYSKFMFTILIYIDGNHKLIIKFTKLLNVFKLLNIIIVIIKMYLSYL